MKRAMSAFGPKRTCPVAPQESAFGGKADMTGCGCLLLRSLLGAKRTWAGAVHMSAYDPKRTSPVERGQGIVRTYGRRGCPTQGTVALSFRCIVQPFLPTTSPTCADQRSLCEFLRGDGRQCREPVGKKLFRAPRAGAMREPDLEKTLTLATGE